MKTIFFYHDALTLMTAKKTREWMREKGYEKLRILPEQNLYKDHPGLKRYYYRPPGDSPELCYLDSNLNEDLYRTVETHVRKRQP